MIGEALKRSFGRSFFGFLIFACLTGLAVWLLRGEAVFREAIAYDLHLLAGVGPRIVGALGVAALVWVLLPRERMGRMIGADSGLRGLMLATLAGVVTPGGPAAAFPLLAALAAAGADRGALVAYVASWSMLGVQRMLIWEAPLMGEDFTLARFALSLPLPVLAGLLARWLPLETTLPPAQADAAGTGR